jgi:hypothetical protein
VPLRVTYKGRGGTQAKRHIHMGEWARLYGHKGPYVGWTYSLFLTMRTWLHDDIPVQTTPNACEYGDW